MWRKEFRHAAASAHVVSHPPPLDRWTVDDARAVMARLEASGLSVAAFATREGFDVQRLYLLLTIATKRGNPVKEVGGESFSTRPLPRSGPRMLWVRLATAGVLGADARFARRTRVSEHSTSLGPAAGLSPPGLQSSARSGRHPRARR